MSGHVLLIPFHYPPIQGSTGAFRSLGFANWLPQYGWRVTVLTAHDRAYPATSDVNLDLIKSDTKVVRAFALDAKRHLSLFGRYIKLTALPDRWSTWILGGFFSGLRQIKRARPDFLYSTYPVPSSHVIGLMLHKFTGIPWIAEFRDPMVEEDYPSNKVDRHIRIRLEKAIFKHCRRLVTVTPGAKAMYEQRCGRHNGYVACVPNGYDESLEALINADSQIKSLSDESRLTMLHSGFLYDEVRNPKPLLTALHELKSEGRINRRDLRFVFRGGGNNPEYAEQIARLDIADLVEFRPTVPYADAYREMLSADVLVLMQGRQCNRQIPAKVYEYCALQKPLLCLADPDGDTGRLCNSLGLGPSVSLEDKDAIKQRILDLIIELRDGEYNLLDQSILSGMSRRARAGELARVLDEAMTSPS